MCARSQDLINTRKMTAVLKNERIRKALAITEV